MDRSNQDLVLRALSRHGITLLELFKRAVTGPNTLTREGRARRDYERFKNDYTFPSYIIDYCLYSESLVDDPLANVRNLPPRSGARVVKFTPRPKKV